jgi:hypothetical protein
MSGVGFRITRLWAYIAIHSDGDEGVIGVMNRGEWLPLVAADRTRLDALRPYAEDVAAKSGMTVRLVRFDQMTIEEEITR